MFFQPEGIIEAGWANSALKRFLILVNLAMLLQTAGCLEANGANCALKR